MAKARNGIMEDKDKSTTWVSLFEYLHKAVSADKIVCPKSIFHAIEAMFDSRLEVSINEVIDVLSDGLEFNLWDDILRSNIVDAARQFLGKPADDRLTWEATFNLDPHTPAKNRTRNKRINDLSSLPEDVVKRERIRKMNMKETSNKLLEDEGWKRLTRDELVYESKKSTLAGLAGFIGEIATPSIELAILWDKIRKIGLDTQDSGVMNKFAFSDELFSIPYVDIWGSLYAALAERYLQGKEVEEGDWYDTAILATVLPYCNIVTTDRIMKHILVNRLQFDQKYNTRVLSCTSEDLAELQEIIG
jgi:hypothetical protein